MGADTAGPGPTRPTERSRSPRVGGSVPTLLVEAAAWSWRLLVVGGVLVAVSLLLGRLLLLVIPFLVAMFSSALLSPIAAWMRRHGASRGLSTLATMVIAAAALGSVGYFVVERAIAGYPDLAAQTTHVVKQVERLFTNGPFHLKVTSTSNIGSAISAQVAKHQGAVASGVVHAGKTALEVLTGVVLWLFLTVFFVYDGDRIWDWVVGLFPATGAERVRGAGTRAWKTLTGYIGGQFIVALFHAVVIGVSLLILQAPLVAPLALIVFIGSFVPIIGALVAGSFAVLVLLVSGGAVKALILLVILLVENQVEGHLLQPLIVGRYVRLHPVAIAVTLTGGVLLAGLTGAIFAVPLVACVNAAVKFLTGREDVDGNALPPAAEPAGVNCDSDVVWP